MRLHLGHHQDDASGVHGACTHRPHRSGCAACREPPNQLPWLWAVPFILLPNLPVPQILRGKQPLLPGETEAGRTRLAQGCCLGQNWRGKPGILAPVFIFMPSSFVCCFSTQSGASHLQGGQCLWITLCWPGPLVDSPLPSTRIRQFVQLRATSSSPPSSGARHIMLPSLSFPSCPRSSTCFRGRSDTVRCLNIPPMFSLGPPHSCQCWEHLGPSPTQRGLAPPAHSTLLPREPSLGEGKELLMQNKWDQSKQKAAGLLLFIPHPRVGNASTGIHSHTEKGEPPRPPRRAGNGRASRAHGACPREHLPLASHSPCSALGCSAPGCSAEPSPAVLGHPLCFSQLFAPLHHIPPVLWDHTSPQPPTNEGQCHRAARAQEAGGG